MAYSDPGMAAAAMEELNQLEEVILAKVQQRVPARMSEDTYLCKAFRYHDLQGSGWVDFEKFKRTLLPFSPGVGDQDLRAIYGRHQQRNAVHASSSAKEARSEIAFFFPNILQNPLPDAEETQDFLLRKSVAAKAGLQEGMPGTGFDIEPSLLQFVSKGLVSLCQTRPHGELNNLQALEYLSTWLVNNNPNKPEVVEPEVEIPVAMVSEGAAYTVEEPVEEMPTVVEVNIAAEKGDKYMVEFEAPPLVAIYLGDSKTAAEVAAAIDYTHLDLETDRKSVV